jgi:large subunit ribosomal protein L24
MVKTQTRFEKKFKVRRNDNVLVTTGKYKGKTGTIQKVDRENDRVFVSGVNLITRHKKNAEPSQKLASIHISNVSHFIEKDGKVIPSKIRLEVEGSEKKRILTKSGAVLAGHKSSDATDVKVEETKKPSKAAKAPSKAKKAAKEVEKTDGEDKQ